MWGFRRPKRLYGSGHFRSVVEGGEDIRPWAIDGQMLRDVLYQMPHPLARMIAGTFIMDIAKGPLDRVGFGAVGGQVEQLEAGMSGQPLLDLSCIVNLGVVNHDGEAGELRGGVRPVQRGQQVQEQPRGFAVPHTVLGRARGDIERPGQVALLIGARGQHFHLRPFGHPLSAHLGQQAEVQLVRKEEGHACSQLLEGVANSGQLLHPPGVVVLGDQLGSLPLPPQRMPPPPHRLRRHRDPPPGLQFQSDRGTASSGGDTSRRPAARP